MPRAKSQAKPIVVGGRTYHPEFPPSEQDDVERVTKRFKNMTNDQAAAVNITEEELRNFANVFPRLYQVARKNRGRLQAWREAHEDVIQGWDVADFFKTKEDDERDGTAPRKAGAPPEAVDELLRQRRADAVARIQQQQQQQQGDVSRDSSLYDISGGNSKPQTEPIESLESPAAPAAPAVEAQAEAEGSKMASPAQNNDTIDDTHNGLTNEFYEALGSVAAAGFQLQEELSNAAAADKREYYEHELANFTKKLDTAARQAQARRGATLPAGPVNNGQQNGSSSSSAATGTPSGSARVLRNNRKRGHNLALDEEAAGEVDKSGEKEGRALRSKRAQRDERAQRRK
ncbi:hypothetical protein N658DRAFT_505725 [Parathielavia hyrcaniae]|uniref:Uncharacterized protein n=1 Tax=Parathielavia hyrcaniae TaxID=113614 RepID=A0AAN6Q4D6_9PEZI|nr:hypothetical protein N658DRAFT_505725 [Parathielavia hyrcaniae]